MSKRNKILNYKAAPPCARFHKSNAFVRGIMRPFGSGKSVACCWEIFMRAKEMIPCSDGVRRSRWMITRNTLPQLETTTMKTWDDWFPQTIFGRRTRKPPYRQMLMYDDVELEVYFLALDRPEDVSKLESIEFTGVFFNEARNMDYSLISAATGRVGRYPSNKDMPEGVDEEKWRAQRYIIMDTNPPTDDHWWYKCAEEDAWAVDIDGKRIPIEEVDEINRWEFWKQPSGLSDEAENIDNLRGGKNYYIQQIPGKSKEWMNVYIHGNYGFLRHGLSVYGSSWNPDTMTADRDILPIPGATIFVGVDASGRHPAAVFAQRTMRGQLQILRELVVSEQEGLGAKNFAPLLRMEMETYFPKNDFEIWGDPAGEWGTQNDEQTYFDILKSEGIHIRSARDGLRTKERVEGVMSVLNRNVDGQPCLTVSPRCKVLLAGFNGGYIYRRIARSGEESRFHEKPEKNRFSDVHDALQYLLCGSGELRRMYGKRKRLAGTTNANISFNPLCR